ncbi:MAG: Uncharacterized protein G01um101430_263 [Parcubacteria group bacterium Gr01-1014_30]|nr:MAG: Uncharacterized protein G01um101430_263 [Parcubacteria group bacterium Gr01-1014_30]
MTLYAILFTLACVGISETAYLIETRQKGQKPVCFIGEDCLKVLESKYSKVVLFHNDVWGLLFYIAIAILTALLVIGVEPLAWWTGLMQIFVGTGALISVVLVYLQWQVIRVWCFWCVLSALTVFSMGVILLIFKI